jgi:uncharacterized damage-inducible protein DinB
MSYYGLAYTTVLTTLSRFYDKGVLLAVTAVAAQQADDRLDRARSACRRPPPRSGTREPAAMPGGGEAVVPCFIRTSRYAHGMRCDECGYDYDVLPRDVLSQRIVDVADEVARALGALDDAAARRRPAERVWSPLEYACHVRDVHRLFAERLTLMLEQDDPQFANWDQDVTAIESRYAEQDPATVSVELVEAAADIAAIYAQVEGEQWQRPGRRSNGSVFTVETLGVYHLHDVHHHLHDIGR